MSNSGGDVEQPERAAIQKLERCVGEVLERLERARLRAETAESKGAELEELLQRFTGDQGAAPRLLTRLQSLETENTDLRRRLDEGRDGVERLLSQIRFLEGQR